MEVGNIEDKTLSRNDYLSYVDNGLKIKGRFLEGLDLFRDSHQWLDWALKALLALAVGHILSGVIFFFAHNWFDLSAIGKFSIVGGAFILSVISWLGLKLDSKIAQVFGIAATVLVGVFLAVFGQVYQTPALIHTPFVLWAVLTFPFAALSRNLAHWAVWLIIAVISVFAYASSGLLLEHNGVDPKAIWVIAAGVTLLSRIGFDRYLVPGRDWAKAVWFKVLTLVVFGAFICSGFTAFFWSEPNFGLEFTLMIICVVLTAILFIYLYKTRPNLAELTLVTFISFVMALQILARIISEAVGFGDVAGFFLMFLAAMGLVMGMAKAFKHFSRISRRPNRQANSASHSNEKQVSFRELELKTSIEENLSVYSDTQNERDSSPWYVETILAISGILAALFGIVFTGSLLGLIFIRFEDVGPPLLISGIGVYGAAILARRLLAGDFSRHFFNTLIIVGVIAIVSGLGMLSKTVEAVIWASMAIGLVTLFLVKDRIIEFLSAGTMIGALGTELYHHFRGGVPEIVFLSIATMAGLFLLIRPIGGRYFSSAGTAFLISPAILGVTLVHMERLEVTLETDLFDPVNWWVRGFSLVLLVLGIVWVNLERRNRLNWRPPLVVLFPLILAMALLPFGGASALLLILLGYILGSQALAIIGVLAQIYFLYMFYYDLSLSLGVKSYLLLATGIIMVIVWFTSDKYVGREVLS